MPVSRRRFVATIGTAAVATVAGSSSASADSAPEWSSAVTTEINRSDDLEELRTYQPLFNISPAAREKLIGLYGWKATSPEHPTDAYYYWARYTHQEPASASYLDRAVGVLASDAHLHDTEPVIVFVDSETGKPEQATVTGYHHYATDVTDGRYFIQNEHPDLATHVTLGVVDPWHHYTRDATHQVATVEGFAEFGSWLDKRAEWADDGMYENSSNAAIDDPWYMQSGGRSTWWADGTRDARAAKLWLWMGLRGADNADSLRIE